MKKILTHMVLLLSFSNLMAQESNVIVISLEHGDNIPTAEHVYQESQLSTPPQNHILSSFNEAKPEKVDYLVSIRAYGDLKNLIQEKPNWNRAVFERSLILRYNENADVTAIESILISDPYISAVSVLVAGDFSFTAQQSKANHSGDKAGNNNWHLSAINWYVANDLTPGFGNIGMVDTGSLPERSEFSAFDLNSGAFLGGGLNVSKGYSTYYQDRAISELREIDEDKLRYGSGLCDNFDNNPNDGFVFPDPAYVGHGSHVSGLLAARSSTAPGICQNCFINTTQESYHTCNYDSDTETHFVNSFSDVGLYAYSLRYLIDTGIQTANLSLGVPSLVDECDDDPEFITCLVISDANARNVTIVAAAGNDRAPIEFPASDRNVIGVSGIQSDLKFWNESPTNGDNFPPLDSMQSQNNDDCPFYVAPNYFTAECGSNFSWPEEIPEFPGTFRAERYRRVDVAAPARDVMSTLPVGSEYEPQIGDAGCTDAADGMIDGYGPCTGTSMSTPIVAGILQLIRSVNPLLPIGDDDPEFLDGIRDVLLFSSSEYQTNKQHNPWLGFGIPDAEIAVKTVLGVSGGQQMKNRLTPLLALYHEGFEDFAYTVFPQVAVAHALNPAGFYESASGAGVEPIEELTAYPVEEVGGVPVIDIVPQSIGHVFTTPWNPDTQTDTLIPLYRMDKEAVSDPGCFPGIDNPGSCYFTDRQTIMVTDENELESFHALGFEIQSIEGYLIPCPDASCSTSYARIYRVYDTNTDSYYLTQILPPSNFEVLGATLPSIDFDGDGLSKGMEQLLGTSDLQIDTDGDGLTDAKEYPPAGVPYSDPLISDLIFEHGFE